MFNANYLAYFDHTVTELWRRARSAAGTRWSSRGVDVVVGEANIRFRARGALRRPDHGQRGLRALRDHVAKLELLIHRGDELLIEGWLRQVFVDVKSFGKTPIPGWVREALEPYAASADGAGA